MHPNPHFIDGHTEAPKLRHVPRVTGGARQQCPDGRPLPLEVQFTPTGAGRWEVFICKAGLWTVPMHCCKGMLSVPPPTPTPPKRCQIQTLRQTEKYPPTDQHRLILKKTLLPPPKNSQKNCTLEWETTPAERDLSDAAFCRKESRGRDSSTLSSLTCLPGHRYC